jgi:uncharacterized Ntn-hydrolase superfamily protein
MMDDLSSLDAAGPLVSTFSIVGYDPDARAWGIAIASRFLAVGARTCWGAPGVGVAVVQAYLNADNGPGALALLETGVSAASTIDRLMAQDAYAHLRQMAVIGPHGDVATHTGRGCVDWAGGVLGKYCAAQGNMLVNGEGCAAMVAHFEAAQGSLARRLVDALAEGDRVGGDSRGRQAAALYVVRAHDGPRYDVFSEPTIDLRVDDHVDPHGELARLLDLYELVYFPTADDERLELNPKTVTRIQQALTALGDYQGALTGVLDPHLAQILERVARRDNLRKRLIFPLAWFDRRALDYLEQRAQQLTPASSATV